MPFNDKKCKAIVDGSQNYRSTYKLLETVMDWADTTTYLGDIMQSNLKLNQHMALMVDEALKKFGEINHIISLQWFSALAATAMLSSRT